MARVTVNVNKGTSPASAAAALNRQVVFGIVGTNVHTPAAGASYNVPPIGEAFVMESEDDHARAGDYADGTLGQAVASIEAQGNWRIVAIRHDEGALVFKAGTSADDTPTGAELDVDGSGGEAVIATYAGNMHHLVAVPETERDLTFIAYSTDPTANVLNDFTKYGSPVIPTGETRPHKVWVSNAATAGVAAVTITARIMTAVEAMELLESAEDLVDYKPNRITTADRTHNVDAMGDVDNSAANSLVTKMDEVCNELDAIGYANAPGLTNAEFTAWLDINRAERLFGCAPYLTLAGEATPMGMGPVWAASHAARQRAIGFWANPHGAAVKGVNSLRRSIQFNPLSDTSASSVITAANGVSMFRRTGYRLLGGNLMADPTDADAVQQGSVRLVLDDLKAHAEAAGARGLERNVGPGLIDFLANVMRNRLAFLLGVRAVNSGTVRPDTERNTAAELNAGRVHMIVDTDPVKNVRSVNWNIYHT